MITVISPAKRLNERAPAGETLPMFATDARALAKLARALSVDDLCGLMDISPALAALNHGRFAGFTSAQTYSAAHLFDGDTYAGLEFATLAEDARRWAQGHLRILSGLYGLLRPMDGIAPYRLEMGSRLANPKGANLYAFWGDQIAKALRAQAGEVGATAVLNCASVEYFSAVDQKALGLPVITPVFLETQNGAAKVVSFWAKQARGAMARYACENHITAPADLCGFDLGGYRFDAGQSNANRLVFARPYQRAGAVAVN
ncbi:MAG: peroxide stress protein YaaA [Cypionkella sp.]|nr:peroxide stress protein YaaA [Cypionkella sp.]